MLQALLVFAGAAPVAPDLVREVIVCSGRTNTGGHCINFRTIEKMSREIARLALSRSQILCFRRRTGNLDERLPAGAKSLRQAAWAGLQDSMPRAALLSIHARVKDVSSTSWEHRSLLQIWGPRFSDYVVAEKDLPVFSLGRLPEGTRRRARAHDTASRLQAFLAGRRMPFGQAGAEWACRRTASGTPPGGRRPFKPVRIAPSEPTGSIAARQSGTED